MPLVNSYNELAQNNEMPEFECLWHPYGIYPSSTSAITLPTSAGAGGLVPGALMTFKTTGMGSYPPLGFGQGASSGGDSGSSGNPTFPYNWTVPFVDLSPTSSTVYVAGILLGVGSLGLACPATPNTVGSTNQATFVAMVGTQGLCQVLVDNTTTIGHTIIPSTTSGHTGQCSDSGGTSFTYGTTVGVALQAVTVSAGPLPCWVNINIH